MKQAEIMLIVLFVINNGKNTMDHSWWVCSLMLIIKNKKLGGEGGEKETLKGSFAYEDGMYVYIKLK